MSAILGWGSGQLPPSKDGRELCAKFNGYNLAIVVKSSQRKKEALLEETNEAQRKLELGQELKLPAGGQGKRALATLTRYHVRLRLGLDATYRANSTAKRHHAPPCLLQRPNCPNTSKVLTSLSIPRNSPNMILPRARPAK